MSYTIKEIYLSIQGEGANSGRTAVFCRFSGCNLWSGVHEERKEAICKFCDTDFVGIDERSGGKFEADHLVENVKNLWPAFSLKSKPLVICTGGEPLLQLDEKLVKTFHLAGFEVAVETNGTIKPPPGIDWICVSPKSGADLVVNRGNELKLVFPQHGAEPARFENLEFQHFFLQPLDNEERETNTRLAAMYCLEHPQWRLGIQIHKFIGMR